MKDKKSDIRRKKSKRTPREIVIKIGENELTRVEITNYFCRNCAIKNLERFVRKVVREETSLNTDKFQKSVGKSPLGM